MLKKAFGNIKDNESYWYRMARRSEKNRKKRDDDEKKNKIEFQKKMKWIFILTILLVVIYCMNNWYRNYQMANDAIETIAIIENIRHDNHRISDIDTRKVDQYYISYKYKVNKIWRKGISQINGNEYSYYLGKRANIGDTIKLKDLRASPKTVELSRFEND